MSIGLNHKSNTGACHLVTHASGCRLNNSSDSAEERHILIPIFEERRHGDLSLPWQVFGHNWLDLLNQIKVRIYLLLLQSLERLDVINIEICVTSSVELIIYLEYPS
jgi:hypothetical protein